jgi:DNA-binding SARP family transcriptional activator
MRASDAARADGADPEPSLERLRQLYRGHFLEQESEKSWALATREAMREKFLLRIQSVAASHEAAKRWQEAAAIYQRGIELDNLAERLYRGLMICHRELGNHAEALKTYRRCRELLSVVLGVQPNAQTQAVYQSPEAKLRSSAHAGLNRGRTGQCGNREDSACISAQRSAEETGDGGRRVKGHQDKCALTRCKRRFEEPL